jgi:hypothetical protein
MYQVLIEYFHPSYGMVWYGTGQPCARVRRKAHMVGWLLLSRKVPARLQPWALPY